MAKGIQPAKKTFEIDMVLKVTLTVPDAVTEEEAIDALFCMVAVPGKRHYEVASEVVDCEVISVK